MKKYWGAIISTKWYDTFKTIFDERIQEYLK